MITFPPSVMALYDEGRIKTMGLIRFEFGTGTYGFCKSDQPFVYGGVTYEIGGAIEVSDFQTGTGLYANNFTIELAASPNDGLTPSVLQTIEAEDYRDRPVFILDVDIHPDTGETLNVQTMMRGYVDVIDHEMSASGGYKLIAQCETRALDYSRTNARKRNDADQNRRAPGDKIFQHTAKRGREEIFWGRERQGGSSAFGLLAKLGMNTKAKNLS